MNYDTLKEQSQSDRGVDWHIDNETPGMELDTSVAKRNRRRIVKLAIGWIHSKYQSTIAITTLCRACHASERTLERCFKTTYGCSPRQYIQSVRLDSALKCLTQSDPLETTVSQVAMASGFRHMGRFAKEYKRHCGEYPKQTLGLRSGQMVGNVS